MSLLANRHVLPVVIDYAGLGARRGSTGAARPDLTRLIAQGDEGRLGQPHHVEPFHPKALAPFSIHPRRERLATTGAVAQKAQVRTTLGLWHLQHGIEKRRHTVKMRRPVLMQEGERLGWGRPLLGNEGLRASS